MARPRKLAREQIESTCRRLLRERREVRVADVREALRAEYGSCGRTERVSSVLREMSAATPLCAENPVNSSVEELQAQLRKAEARAALAEDREMRHQDYWAQRFDERTQELERKYAAELAALRRRPSSDDFLKVHQRLADALRRIAAYESGEIPLPGRG